MDLLDKLDPWLDDDLVTAAETVITDGPPDNEHERSALALTLGAELQVLSLANAHLRVLVDEWHAERREIGPFKTGLAELRREEYLIAKTRQTYHLAIGRLKLTAERKAVRSTVLDLAVRLVEADAFADGFMSAETGDEIDAFICAVRRYIDMRPGRTTDATA